MLGAIAGDIIGSVYEARPIKTTNFRLFHPLCRFTDDTVLTVALADSLMHGAPFVGLLKQYYRAYPHAGYGGSSTSGRSRRTPAPTTVGATARLCGSARSALPSAHWTTCCRQAKRSAEVTHDHPEGIKGAQAVASAVFLARTGQSKDQIKSYVERAFGYNLDTTLDEIRPRYEFQVSCQKSVPQAIRAFLESDNFEDAVRKAISLGGDSDTLACMAGGIAQAFFGGVPRAITSRVYEVLDDQLGNVTRKFTEAFGCP